MIATMMDVPLSLKQVPRRAGLLNPLFRSIMKVSKQQTLGRAI